uniref:Uncharacterized protein n=1 Tax=Sphaerodactylus townsendi TaxID=933632 RepID=A0ACB8FHY2_9SAUR
MDDRGGGWRDDERPCEEGEREQAEAFEGEVVGLAGAAAAEALESDWSFIDCDMDTVSLQDLPSALIACNLPLGVFFGDGPCRSTISSMWLIIWPSVLADEEAVVLHPKYALGFS